MHTMYVLMPLNTCSEPHAVIHLPSPAQGDLSLRCFLPHSPLKLWFAASSSLPHNFEVSVSGLSLIMSRPESLWRRPHCGRNLILPTWQQQHTATDKPQNLPALIKAAHLRHCGQRQRDLAGVRSLSQTLCCGVVCVETHRVTSQRLSRGKRQVMGRGVQLCV